MKHYIRRKVCANWSISILLIKKNIYSVSCILYVSYIPLLFIHENSNLIASVKSQEKSTSDVTLRIQESGREYILYSIWMCTTIQTFLLFLSQSYFKLKDSCILRSEMIFFNMIFSFIVFDRYWYFLHSFNVIVC